MARTLQSTLTCTMRSSEHAAHRLLMHSGHISHLWLKVSPCVSFHIIHACALVSCLLSVSPHPSFYFLVLFLFPLYLMSNSAPDEFSIEDPLCNSSLGSMVTLDYVTPLTVQVIAHKAAAAVPNSVLQYLKAGQITPLSKPAGGHRPLLMMSFLRRLALKSVMAGKKESVAKCAGPLQYGVGRPDGANTMIKTIQYLAEADNSRVLVALDLKAAFQNVSRRAMLHSIAQTDTDLAAVFSKWYTGTTEH